jgi:hypothetical protein
MVITDYRVQSVLRTYGRQLKRSGAGKHGPDGQEEDASVERVIISDEVRRRLIMERMTSQVLEKAYPKQEGTAGEENGIR